jgi:osmotically-inducible protein OsmY
LSNKIQAGIKTEPSLADSSISIDTTDQSVDLKGDVSSQVAKNKALEIARANAGGRKVIDHLRVMSKPFWR